MSQAWDRLRPRILRRIKPTADGTRRARAAAREIVARCRKEAQALGRPCKAVVVGSLAKDTHLRPKPDIDVFLLFPKTVGREELERLGLRIGRQVLRRPSLKYAEHPYVRGLHRGFHFDVVPAYEIMDATERMSAVDRSPLHLEYVRKHLRPSQRDEVRLLKQFLKGIGCYGAETATGGFSGYMAELLILRFGTFWDALVALRERHPPIELGLDGPAAPLGGALVFADPVDPRRNAAAAVTGERLETFLRAARAFTAKPEPGFFWPRAVEPESRQRLLQHLSHRGVVGLEAPAPRVTEDARIPHLRRLLDKVTRRLQDEGFQVVRSVVEPVSPHRFLLLWEHEPVLLPPEYEHRGPRIQDTEHARRFRSKWETHPDRLGPLREDQGRWVASVRRRRRSPLEVLSPELAQLLQGLDIPASAVARMRLRPAMELAARPGLRPALTRFLRPQDPWTVS